MDTIKKSSPGLLAVSGIITMLTILSGCSKVDSSDLKSSGFYTNMHVTARGNDITDVWVNLRTGSGIGADKIVLSEGDILRATANGITKTLENDGPYETSFNFDEGGTEFVISLDRSDGDNMPNSRVILPPKFDILMPSSNEIFDTGETITVSCSPSLESETIEVAYGGDCIYRNDGREYHFGRVYVINDVGTHSVLVDDILNVYGDHSKFDKNITCSSRVLIERENTGTIDPNYGKGGTIDAMQTRSVAIGINP